MKCTNNFLLNLLNKKLLCIICVAAIFITGCGETTQLTSAYDISSNDYTVTNCGRSYFSDGLCVTEDINFGTDTTSSQVAEGAGVFNVDTQEVVYSQNLFKKLYPASTTKILTCYIILKYANLDDLVTVSYEAAHPGPGSSVCGIAEGDVISVRDLLYGLMLVSGNDAAVALAEYYSGNIEEFAKVMNEEALSVGATNSHFVNPHGFPDEDHYTTIYDMYLITENALKMDAFREVFDAKSYSASFTDSNGNKKTKEWNTTNQYLTGFRKSPKGIKVLGGKTGTTNAAGYCLVLHSQNKKKETIISIVFKADARTNLYLLMGQILSGFAN